MDYCMEIMQTVVQTLKEILKKYTEEYEAAIIGSLICNYNHGRNRFYHAHNDNGKYVRSCLSLPEDQEKFKGLARKEYLRVEIIRIKKDIEILETALSGYATLEPTETIQQMKRAYRLLDATWFYNEDIMQIRETLAKELRNRVGSLEMKTGFQPLSESKILLHKPWAEQPYERNPYPFGDDEIYTSDGTRARSKAEAMVYECALKYRIPFKFDALITIVGPEGIPFELAPDFIFEDGNFQEFYLEFCGMMDDEKYVRRHLIKRKNYEKAGIVPWRNMIYLYSAGNDIDMGYVESIIRNQVMPRL